MDKKTNILGRALAKLSLMQKQLTEESQVLDELKAQEEADACELETLRAELETKNASILALNEELKKRASDKEKLETCLKSGSVDLKNLRDKHDALKEDLEARLLKLAELNASNQHLLRSLREKEESYKAETEAARAEAAAKEKLSSSLREELRKREAENADLAHKLLGKAAEYKTELERERAEFRINYEKLEYGAAEAEKGLMSEAEALRESLRQKAAEVARAGAETQSLLGKQEALAADYEARLAKLEVSNASLKEELKKQKAENEALSKEIRAQAAEALALLESERAEAKNAQTRAHNEARSLGETIKVLRHESDKMHADLEKARQQYAEIKSLRDAGAVKVTELELFSKSASSALKENKEELELLKERLKDLTDELSKHSADSRRRQELLRLELEEKNKQIARHNRELEAVRAEKESLKNELDSREKEKR